MIYLVASATGKDRPGFVHSITSVIKAAGGNIEQQRSSRVADEYSLLLLFTVPSEEAARQAVDSLTRLQSPHLLIHARKTEPGPASLRDATPAELMATGADQPGILDAVTSLLLQHRINIDEMDFDIESAPMTGDPLFRMDARVSIPPGVDLAVLRQKFRELEDDYNFDVLFRCPAP